MKKITFLLTFMLTAVVGMWGQTAPTGTVQVSSATLETGYYYLYNNGAGKYLDGSTTAYAWVGGTDLTGSVGLWYIQNLGAGSDGNIRYYVQADGTNYYFGGVGPQCPINTSAVYQRISVRESGAYYTLSGHQDVSMIGNKTAIKYNGTSGDLIYRNGGTITDSSFPTESQWVIYKLQQLTYTVSIVGCNDASAGVQYGGNTYSNGDTFTAGDDISVSDFTPNTVSGYSASVSINGATIQVTYIDERFEVNLTDLYVTNMSVAPTTNPIVEGQWYLLTQVRGGESPAYDSGAGHTMYRAANTVTANSLLVTNTPANDIKQYLIRFFNTGVGDGYYIQFGTGNLWSNVKTTADLASASSYLVYNATQGADQSTGWAINKTTDGATYGEKVDNNAAGYTLSFWGTGQTTTGTNNIWKLYPVELGAFISNVSNITINVLKGSDIVKTVTVEDVAEGREINVAEALGNVAFVSSYNPATITAGATDQTVDVTYTSSLPFELSADPTDTTTSTAYFMTLRQKYLDGNSTISSSVSNVDLADNGYYWTFGGNEFQGITVYNRGEGGYMSVENADNSVATFGATPVAFTISANSNETNGFNLCPVGTVAYINERDGKLSTWNVSWATSDAGSCLKVYSVDEVVGALVAALDPYFTYAGAINALTPTAAQSLQPTYNALLAAPDYTQYLALKAQVEAALVPVTEGYYVVLSCAPFMDVQGVEKAMYFETSNGKIRWNTLEGSAAQVLKLVASGSSYTLYSPFGDVYLATKKGVTGTQADALAFDVTASKPASVALVYNADGGTDAAIHCNGHDNGNGTSGDLTNWSANAGASLWRFVPVAIDEITLIAPEGVADGEEVMQGFANATDAQLPLNITVYTISDETGVGAHLETIGESQIAGGQGYIISGVKGATVPLLPVTAAVTAPAGNLLVAGTGEKVYGGYILAYKKGDAEAKFWAISSTGLAVPANRSYLPAGTPTRGLEFLLGNGYIDDVTGINGVNAGAASEGAIYDLQGRRVNNATKGVYIINGKKVIK